MFNNQIHIIVSSAFLALVILAGQINAQPGRTGDAQPVPKTRVAPAVAPPGYGGVPRLGFMGQIISGYGMRVMRTNYGSPADRAGLEGGDIIISINGRRIRNQYDYNDALRQAALYNAGYVSMSVRNIRYDTGLSSREFVRVSTRLSEYAVPARGVEPAVAAYSEKWRRVGSTVISGKARILNDKQGGAVSKIKMATPQPLVRKDRPREGVKK